MHVMSTQPWHRSLKGWSSSCAWRRCAACLLGRPRHMGDNRFRLIDPACRHPRSPPTGGLAATAQQGGPAARERQGGQRANPQQCSQAQQAEAARELERRQESYIRREDQLRAQVGRRCLGKEEMVAHIVSGFSSTLLLGEAQALKGRCMVC